MMILSTLLLGCFAAAPEATTTWSAPVAYMAGRSYEVSVTISAPDAASLPAPHPPPAAFALGTQPLGPRGKSTIQLAQRAALTLPHHPRPAPPPAGRADAGSIGVRRPLPSSPARPPAHASRRLRHARS